MIFFAFHFSQNTVIHNVVRNTVLSGILYSNVNPTPSVTFSPPPSSSFQFSSLPQNLSPQLAPSRSALCRLLSGRVTLMVRSPGLYRPGDTGFLSTHGTHRPTNFISHLALAARGLTWVLTSSHRNCTLSAAAGSFLGEGLFPGGAAPSQRLALKQLRHVLWVFICD